MSTPNKNSDIPKVAKPKRQALGNLSSQQKKDTKKVDTLSWKIEKCQLVYFSKLETDQEICAICKSALTDPCNICQTNGIIDNCQILQGECGHFFHGHCIAQWLKRAKTCPICNAHWEPVA